MSSEGPVPAKVSLTLSSTVSDDMRNSAEVPGVTLNGHPTHRLPGNVNLAFEGLESEVLLLALDLEGIAASAGAACTAGSVEPSHVVAALGATPERVRGSVRFSLGRETTREQVEAVIARLPPIIARLRR